MRRHLAYALGLIGMESSALIALALSQPLYSAEWICALVLVPVVLGMLPLGLGLTEKGRDRVARLLHPLIAVLGLGICAACFVFEDRASLGFVFPIGLIGLNLTLPRERAVAFIALACGSLLLPLSAGNDLVLLLVTLLYVFSLLLHLSGAFFRAMEQKDARHFIAPAPGHGRLIAITYLWTTALAVTGGAGLSWAVGETRAHPFSIDLPAGGLLFNTAGVGADGEPLLSSGGQRLLSALAGKLKGESSQSGAGSQVSEGRISQGSKSAGAGPGPAGEGAAQNDQSSNAGQAQPGGAAPAQGGAPSGASDAAGGGAGTGNGMGNRAGNGGGRAAGQGPGGGAAGASAAVHADVRLIKTDPHAPQGQVCGLDIGFPESNPALREVMSPLHRSGVIKVPVGFALYLRQRVYGDYDIALGRWACDKPHLVLQPQNERLFRIDYPGNSHGYSRNLTVLKQIGPWIPAPLRPRELAMRLPGIEVSESHALRAPRPLRQGDLYSVNWLEGAWGGNPPRPTAEDAQDPRLSTFLDVPASLRRPLQDYLDRNFGPWGDQLAAGSALEAHFRTRYQHTLAHLRTAKQEAGAAPADPVLRVLAERRGHAEELATAFVLMARMLDMPARLATGYVANRASVSSTECCEVHQIDAHAWAEVRIGNSWTTFDPARFRPPPNNADFPAGRTAWRGYLENLDLVATAYDQTLPGFPDEPTAWVRNSTEEERRLLKLWHGYLWLDGHWPWLLAGACAVLVCLSLARRPLNWLRYEWQLLRLRDPRRRVLMMYAHVERVSRMRGVRRLPGEHHVAYLARCALRWPDWKAALGLISDAFSLARYGPAPVDAALAARVNQAARGIIFSWPRTARPGPQPRQERAKRAAARAEPAVTQARPAAAPGAPAADTPAPAAEASAPADDAPAPAAPRKRRTRLRRS
jgi:hypothetical protein